jgi:hypothetical protein
MAIITMAWGGEKKNATKNNKKKEKILARLSKGEKKGQEVERRKIGGGKNKRKREKT